MGPGVRASMAALRPSKATPPKVSRSRWNANATSQAPSVGREVKGALVEKTHGHATAQLQFSKYSPSMDQGGVAVAVIGCLLTPSWGRLPGTMDTCRVADTISNVSVNTRLVAHPRGGSTTRQA